MPPIGVARNSAAILLRADVHDNDRRFRQARFGKYLFDELLGSISGQPCDKPVQTTSIALFSISRGQDRGRFTPRPLHCAGAGVESNEYIPNLFSPWSWRYRSAAPLISRGERQLVAREIMRKRIWAVHPHMNW
jgi:hypothetical protein